MIKCVYVFELVVDEVIEVIVVKVGCLKVGLLIEKGMQFGLLHFVR